MKNKKILCYNRKKVKDGKKAVIFFDDECLFCNKAVQFILKKDQGYFMFCALKSEYAKEVFSHFQIEVEDTVYLLEKGNLYKKSQAVFLILKKLDSFFRFFSHFLIFPLGFTDYCYDLLAQNRHQFFPKNKNCAFYLLKRKNVL